MADDVAARRARLCAALPPGETFTGIFTRREKSKSGHPRYYLFDEAEDLQLAAELHEGRKLCFPISLGSVDFAAGSPLHVGVLKHVRESATYALEVQGAEVLSVRYLCRWERPPRDPSRVMVVTQIGGGGAARELVQLDFRANIGKRFPGMDGEAERSVKNFYLATPAGEHQFSFSKLHEDEYHFAASGGLSVVQGFAIAVSTFYKVRHE